MGVFIGEFFPLFFWFFFLFLKPYSYMIIHFYFHTLLFCCPYINAWAQKKNVSKRKENCFTWKTTHRKIVIFSSEFWGRNVYLGLCVKIIISLLDFSLLFKWFRICYNSSQFIFNFFVCFHALYLVITIFVWKAIFQKSFIFIVQFSILSSTFSPYPPYTSYCATSYPLHVFHTLYFFVF